MATYKILDRADEFRIEIIGRFSGDGVQEVQLSWEEALREPAPRRLSIDISRLSGYDSAGRKLLSEMYRHGTEFAARTPSSLIFLNEISTAPRTAATLLSAPAPKRRTAAEQHFRPPLAAGQ